MALFGTRVDKAQICQRIRLLAIKTLRHQREPLAAILDPSIEIDPRL
jgi:hypothetical protein